MKSSISLIPTVDRIIWEDFEQAKKDTRKPILYLKNKFNLNKTIELFQHKFHSIIPNNKFNDQKHDKSSQSKFLHKNNNYVKT